MLVSNDNEGPWAPLKRKKMLDGEPTSTPTSEPKRIHLMDGTYVRCPKLLITVAMVQCYRSLDALVPSKALAGTFTIGFRTLNL